MTDRIMALAPLKDDEWSLVRDIIIPINRNQQAQYGVTEAEVQNATCFIGEPKARRLWDPDNPNSLQRVLNLFSELDPILQLGYSRIRISVDGMSFRAQVGRNAEGEDLTLRALPHETPSLNDLRMPRTWRALLLDQSLLDGGLVLVVAPNGQGKTTTASSTVRTRLETFGGLANTCEDPVELPLQGVWGDGVCMQRPAVTPGENGVDRNMSPGEAYHRSLQDALRQFPAITGGGTILFVGEILDAQTAAETLKAASNGHLVVATLHAKSVTAAVRRMATLCAGSQDGMDMETVRDLMADSLRGVFHQRLVWAREGEGWSRAEVKGNVLWNEKWDSPVGKAIRGGQFDSLHDISKRQDAELRRLEQSFSANEKIPGAKVKEAINGT